MGARIGELTFFFFYLIFYNVDGREGDVFLLCFLKRVNRCSVCINQSINQSMHLDVSLAFLLCAGGVFWGEL